MLIASNNFTLRYAEDVPSTEVMCRGMKNGGNSVGWNRIMVEADCMVVIEVLKNAGNYVGRATTIYKECSF
jgi:hypothetical protein